jgi:hypothetical protein
MYSSFNLSRHTIKINIDNKEFFINFTYINQALINTAIYKNLSAYIVTCLFYFIKNPIINF